MGANERRVAIWHTLCRYREVNAASLAVEYHVSRRTILTDIDILSQVYPIVSVMGRYGGYRLADWYDPQTQILSPSELKLILRLRKTLHGNDALLFSSIISRLSNCPFFE